MAGNGRPAALTQNMHRICNRMLHGRSPKTQGQQSPRQGPSAKPRRRAEFLQVETFVTKNGIWVSKDGFPIVEPEKMPLTNNNNFPPQDGV